MMTAQQPALSHESSRPKLLFADDHHLVLDALAFMAGSEYEVLGVDSSAGFEAGVDEFSPDLGILDVRMPDANGFEVARRVLKKQPDLKLMFLSMHTESRFVRQAMEIGAKGYLSKRAPAEE